MIFFNFLILNIAPPVIKDPELHYKVLSGDSASLTCDATGYPEPHKIWLKDSVLIQNSSSKCILTVALCEAEIHIN